MLKKIRHEKPTTDSVMHDMGAPSFHVDSKQMPEMKDWKVGGKYKMIVEVEQKSMNKDEMGMSGRFEILAYEHMKEKSMDEMDDKEFGEYQGKMLANKKL